MVDTVINEQLTQFVQERNKESNLYLYNEMVAKYDKIKYGQKMSKMDNKNVNNSICHILQMRTQQSFHPVLPNVILYDRMFRAKPYTKCIDCLTQDKLRCHNCMEMIISDIAKKSSPKKVYERKKVSPISRSQHFYQSQNVRPIKTSCSGQKLQTQGPDIGHFRSTKQSEQKIMITSKYNWWLNEKKKRRRQDQNLSSTIGKNWPRKTKTLDYNLQKLRAKQPRFEKMGEKTP